MSAPYPLPDHPAAAWVSPNVAWEHFTGWTEEPEDLIDDRFGPDPSEIVAVGVCGGCHERRTLVAHGAVCADCLDDLMPYAGCPPCPPGVWLVRWAGGGGLTMTSPGGLSCGRNGRTGVSPAPIGATGDRPR